MNWLCTLGLIIVAELVFLVVLWKRSHLRRGYHIKLHVRHLHSSAKLKPIVWHHPGPWEQTLKHLPHSGTVMGDKVVEAWEIRSHKWPRITFDE